MDRRNLAVEYFIKSLTSGEQSAADRLAGHLADDVAYDTSSQPGVPPIGRETFNGKPEVLDRVSGDWPATSGYGRLGWSDPIEKDGKVLVTTSGAVSLTFAFNEDDQIREVRLDGGWGSGVAAPAPSGGPVTEIPLVIKGLINNARVNGTTMIVTYVDAAGAPQSSFRGSTCVLSPTELAIWVRDANGGLPRALASNPRVTLVYSDFRGGGMVTVAGSAHVDDDPAIRRKVFELGLEVEQKHDLDRKGVAVVIKVEKLQGFVNGVGYSLVS